MKTVRFVSGQELWRAGEERLWSWDLLAAALSRSDSPQGDSVTDGRTQDLIGLGLVEKLARQPRGWLLEHRDGLRSAVLVLDGVIADYTFAIKLSDGSMMSAQLYRPPKPARQEFSLLAAALEDAFRNGHAPWSADRGLLVSGLLEGFRNACNRPGELVEMPAP